MSSKKSIKNLGRITTLLSTRRGVTFYELLQSIKRSNRSQVIMRQVKILVFYLLCSLLYDTFRNT